MLGIHNDDELKKCWEKFIRSASDSIRCRWSVTIIQELFSLNRKYMHESNKYLLIAPNNYSNIASH